MSSFEDESSLVSRLQRGRVGKSSWFCFSAAVQTAVTITQRCVCLVHSRTSYPAGVIRGLSHLQGFPWKGERALTQAWVGVASNAGNRLLICGSVVWCAAIIRRLTRLCSFSHPNVSSECSTLFTAINNCITFQMTTSEIWIAAQREKLCAVKHRQLKGILVFRWGVERVRHEEEDCGFWQLHVLHRAGRCRTTTRSTHIDRWVTARWPSCGRLCICGGRSIKLPSSILHIRLSWLRDFFFSCVRGLSPEALDIFWVLL